jgi:hypothetical protein
MYGCNLERRGLGLEVPASKSLGSRALSPKEPYLNPEHNNANSVARRTVGHVPPDLVGIINGFGEGPFNFTQAFYLHEW